MTLLTDTLAKDLAEYILLGQVEDVEYLTVWEITSDHFTFGEDQEKKAWEDLTDEEQEAFIKKVDSYISKATVTITFSGEL